MEFWVRALVGVLGERKIKFETGDSAGTMDGMKTA